KRAEQVEIEFLPVPIEDAADHLVLAKWIIRNVAYNYGYAVTFVPKLETGHAGNGMHVHMMLRKDGRNALVDGGELNENAKKLIGGLSHYAPSLTAFGNTVAGSYLRLVPHQEAPTNVCWSAMNRSALIRVPLGWSNVENLADIVNPGRSEKIENPDSRQTVELRSPDGSAHTHFLLAGITMAAEWGLANPDFALEIADRCHVEGNIHDHGTENLDQLATSCAESAEKLIKDRSLYVRDGIFTDRMIDHMAELLRKENDKELNKRLMSLPEAEKLDESRRIMHRDLHKH
ncbi:MAG: glutamine synthetase, partial [Candidatus Kapaibacterium sp.]